MRPSRTKGGEGMLYYKSGYGSLQVKTASTSTALQANAVIASFYRPDGGLHIDRDGDAYTKDAFPDGVEVLVSQFNHSLVAAPGALPAGKALLRNDGRRAIASIKFFSTSAGRETWQTLKEAGGLTEFSYAFDILDAEPVRKNGQNYRLLKSLRVFEISPVLQGAAGTGYSGTVPDSVKATPHGVELAVMADNLVSDWADDLRREYRELLDPHNLSGAA